MREQHGVARARRLGRVEGADTQGVLVIDSRDEVVLSLSDCAYPAGLTPEQAEFIAEQLQASAQRVRDAEAARATTVQEGGK